MLIGSSRLASLLALAAFLACVSPALSSSAQLAPGETVMSEPGRETSAFQLTLEDAATRRAFRRRVAGGVTPGFLVGAGITTGTLVGLFEARNLNGVVGITLSAVLPMLTMTLAMGTGALLGRSVHSLKFARAFAAAALGVLAGGVVLAPFMIPIATDGGGAILLAGSAVSALAMVVTTTLLTVRFARNAERTRLSLGAGLGSVSLTATF